jgi:hypothetical protein
MAQALTVALHTKSNILQATQLTATSQVVSIELT